MLETIDFRKTEKGTVGQLHIGYPLQNMLELLACFIVLFLTESQQARQKLCANGNLLIGIILKHFECLRRLIVNLLRHEGFADAKLGLNGMRRAAITIGYRGILNAGHIKPLPLEITLGQQQLQPGFCIFTLLFALRFFGISKFNQPASQNILHIGQTLLVPACHQMIANELNQVGRKVIAMLFK